jgi:cysteinyl-tRNA synthetase
VLGLGAGSGGEEIGARAAAAADAFAQAMDDDLNVPEAVGHLFGAIRDLNRLLDAVTPSAEVRQQLIDLVAEADDVLGVLPLVDRERARSALSPEEEGLLARRVAARAARDFAESDRMRAQLLERGIMVEDTAQGQRWKRA